MKILKVLYLPVVLVFLLTVFAAAAPAQDILYISEPSLYDVPKVLPRNDGSLWNANFKDNPALLSLDTPCELIFDAYYLGFGRSVSTDGFSVGIDFSAPPNPAYKTSRFERKYLTTTLGADTGFAMRLSDRSDLALIVGYRYGRLSGDGNFTITSILPARPFGAESARADGSTSEKSDSHALSLSLLWALHPSDRVSVGAGLAYAYLTEYRENEISGSWLEPWWVAPIIEVVDIDRELRLRYHRISPSLGINLAPSDRFRLDAFLRTSFFFGGVKKESSLFDDAGVKSGTPAPSLWTEDIGPGEVGGWEISAGVRPGVTLSDALSIPVILDFSYRDFTWKADGIGSGYFAPDLMNYIYHGPGTIEYEDNEVIWHVTTGAGVVYDAGWGTLTGRLTYTRWELRHAYDQENLASGAFYNANGLTAYAQRDVETRDILSVDLDLEKAFSDALSARFGLCYVAGWGYRDYYESYASPYETTPSSEFMLTTDGRDTYQDLVLSTEISLRPAERLNISLLGTVTIPLDPLDYDMAGTTANGNVNNNIANLREFYAVGPASRGYESSGWDWGLLFSLTYEFGCPKPIPPVIEEPKIAPILEPMSLK